MKYFTVKFWISKADGLFIILIITICLYDYGDLSNQQPFLIIITMRALFACVVYKEGIFACGDIAFMIMLI